LKTWIAEFTVVWLVLIGVVAVTRGGLLEALGSLAVLAAFAHAQVAERMRELEALKAKPDVHCHRWLTRYFLAKELLWCAYFVAHRSWAALAGVGVFLLYPLWREWWRARHPLPKQLTLEQKLENAERRFQTVRDSLSPVFGSRWSTLTTTSQIEQNIERLLLVQTPVWFEVQVLPTIKDPEMSFGQLRVRMILGGHR
jgi:hypothetical protein